MGEGMKKIIKGKVKGNPRINKGVKEVKKVKPNLVKNEKAAPVENSQPEAPCCLFSAAASPPPIFGRNYFSVEETQYVVRCRLQTSRGMLRNRQAKQLVKANQLFDKAFDMLNKANRFDTQL